MTIGGALPASKSFVVQFTADTVSPTGPIRGRVEHIVSCRDRRFSSLDELLAFMVEVLGSLDTDLDG